MVGVLRWVGRGTWGGKCQGMGVERYLRRAGVT